MRQSLAERAQADKGTFLQSVLQFAETLRFGFRTNEIVSHSGLDAPSTHTVSAAVSGRRPWTSCFRIRSMAKCCGLREPTCFDVAHEQTCIWKGRLPSAPRPRVRFPSKAGRW